jgi:phosphonate transport system permease protein
MQMEYLPLKKEKDFYTWAGVLLVIFTAAATGYVSQFNVFEAIRVMPGVLSFIFTDFLPPSYVALPNIVQPLLDTFYMAVVSTVTAATISLVLAFLCATPTMPHPAFKIVIRAFASLLRNIPALAWTMILIPAFGIGKSVGVIALIIGSLGSMTRFFTETIEEIDIGKIEAIRSSGGSYWQVLRAGVMPQCTPGLISWTLYSLELDIRASTIIGMVGGGGIGFYIQSTIKLFKYDHAAMAIFIVAILVIIIELLTKKIRERIM